MKKLNEKAIDDIIINESEMKEITQNKKKKSQNNPIENSSAVDLSFRSNHINSDDSQVIQSQPVKDNDIYRNKGIPENLMKTFYFVLILFSIGIALLFIGSIIILVSKTFNKALPFWIIGCLLLIPGGYYIYQFYLLRKVTDEMERNEIIDQIPEL